MQQRKWYDSLRGTLYPLLMSVLGLILVINPDIASALLGRITGWALILIGLFAIAYSLFSKPVRIAPLILGIVVLIPAIYLAVNPMALAVNIGKIGGILLLIQGINGLFQLQDLRDWGLSMGGSWIVPVVTLILGIGLIFSPVSASRVVFRIMGVIFLVIGVVNLVSRIMSAHNRPKNDRPDIIDADE